MRYFNSQFITISGFGKQTVPYCNFTSGLPYDSILHFCMLPFIIPWSFVDMWPFTPTLFTFM